MRIGCCLLLVLGTQTTLVPGQETNDWPSFRNTARANKSCPKDMKGP